MVFAAFLTIDNFSEEICLHEEGVMGPLRGGYPTSTLLESVKAQERANNLKRSMPVSIFFLSFELVLNQILEDEGGEVTTEVEEAEEVENFKSQHLFNLREFSPKVFMVRP